MDLLLMTVLILITLGILVGITGIITAFRYKEWQTVGLVASIVGLILIMSGSFIVVYMNQPERAVLIKEEEEEVYDTSEEIYVNKTYPTLRNMAEQLEELWATHWKEMWQDASSEKIRITEVTATLHTVDREYERVQHELHGVRQETMNDLKEPFSLRVCDLFDALDDIIQARQEIVQQTLPMLRQGVTEEGIEKIERALEKESEAINHWEKKGKELALLARSTPRKKTIFHETERTTLPFEWIDASF